jgi:Helix-turn-helix domain
MATQPQTRISKAEAAERFGCSTKKIDRLRAAKELVAVKSSREQQGHVQITLDSLEAYEQRQFDAAQH